MEQILKNRLVLKPIKEHSNEKDYIKSSKIGGVPYWNSAKDVSIITEDDYMLIAQLNLDEVDSDLLKAIHKDYPTAGILQFFIGNGENINRKDYMERCMVIHHENSNLPHQLPTDYTEKCLNLLNENHDLPIMKNIIVSLESAKPDIILIAESSYEENEVESINDKMIDEQLIMSKIGGIPFMCQSGIDVVNFDYDSIPLLYLADCYNEDYNLDIMWGDGGEGLFTIDKDSLAQKDFNNVELYWECG